ncbi:MAG: ABC transporter substrate-binding protein [Proteobacteria bacterium]|nr:ABC transporter substrate-binding protein [Pseudomonadota bacterium]
MPHAISALLAVVLAAAAAGGASAAAIATPAAAAPVAVDDSDPGQLIETAAQAMLRELDAHRDEYRRDPAKIDGLVDRILLPHFDTDYSARLVLGRHWNSATPEQRQRFVNAFYHSLLDNYGTALLDFTSDRLKVIPYKGDAASPNATVRTQVRKNDGTVVAVNYSLHHTARGWMAWDVVIEGISYVKSFRDDFGAEIDAHGVDALIDRLEKQTGNSK